MKKRYRLICLIFSCIFAGALQADNIRGRIVKIQGQVFIVNDNNERRTPEKSNFLVNNGETVVTDENSKAVIQFAGGVLSVLDEKSRLRVEKAGWFSQLSGKAYYIFKKVFNKQPQKVYTKFATIGIRGTAFIVNASDNDNMIALEEGNLKIESPGDDYAIRKQRKTDDFSDFRNEHQRQLQMMDQEYSDYKKQLENEFFEYKKSFELAADYQVSFNGRNVEQVAISSDIKRAFGDFTYFAAEYISAYKEPAYLD
ncbi:MAG: FecR domain-containing protein [Gammaproteobacteria bacterium]|nr:FecR domain-containing protein [Gammaproteobacteria bacterium]